MKIVNWFNQLDVRLDSEINIKNLIVIGLGVGVIFWSLFGVIIAAFGN